MNLDPRLVKQARTATALLALAIAAGFLGGIGTVLQARQVSRVISGVFLGGQSLADVWPLLWGLLAIVAGRAVLTFVSESSAGAAAVRVKDRLRARLSAHLLALGPGYAQGEQSGELVNLVTQGIEALDAYFSQYLPQLALAGLLPLAYLIIVFPLDPISGIVLLLTGPLIPVFMFLIGATAEGLTRRQWTALSRMSAYFLDTLQGLSTLKALGRSRRQSERIAQVSERYRDTTLSVLRVTFLSALALELLGTIGTAIVAVQVGLRLLYGRLGFEEAFFLLLLAPDFYLPLRALGLRFHASMAGVTAAKRIYEVLERQPERESSSGLPAHVNLREPFSIKFDGISFTYPGRDNPAVDGLSLCISSGEMVALVGPSGAGKSTAAQVLLRLFAPQRGQVLVNGVKLEDVPVEEWRAQVAWVPQQPYLFAGTLAENLRLARPDASQEDLWRAAELAYLDGVIDQLPQGWNTAIGEFGTRLSGGQAQRLALARAFLRDAPLLVLDEPTAHLDIAQEKLLQEALNRLCAGRSVLVIAHRLPTAARADRILVMDGGRVVESGTHADLLARGGAYARLLAAYRGGAV